MTMHEPRLLDFGLGALAGVFAGQDRWGLALLTAAAWLCVEMIGQLWGRRRRLL
jgi:hypothetical protein